jgi:DUF2075 family protein
LKSVQNLARKNAWYDNVAAVVLQSEASSQADQGANAQVLDAVEKKYDALRDKILVEVCKNAYNVLLGIKETGLNVFAITMAAEDFITVATNVCSNQTEELHFCHLLAKWPLS